MSLPSAPPPPPAAPREPQLVPPSTAAHLAVRMVLLVAVLGSVAYALLRPAGAGGADARSYGAPDALLALGVLVALTASIISGPEPRLATRWAWFWLVAYVWPAAVVYLLLEPTAAWRREPATAPRRRLTGGWAFLIGALVGTPLTALLATR